MDTRFWGPSGWQLLHSITFKATSLPKDKLYTFFHNLPFVLPCKFCRASLADYYLVDPIPTNANDYAEWLYRIHNRVNMKLRDQKLLTAKDPSWVKIQQQYRDYMRMPCTKRKMVGWDFLFSVAYTTPGPSVSTSPMPGAPPIEMLTTPELRNRWGKSPRTERLRYIEEWWAVLPDVLPFKEWSDAWAQAVSKNPPVSRGRRAFTAWLYTTEKAMCTALEDTTPHDSFHGLCTELNNFTSGCGANRSLKMKTCRAIKAKARKTLKYRQGGGFR